MKVTDPIFDLPMAIAPNEIWMYASLFISPRLQPGYCISNYGRILSNNKNKLMISHDNKGYVCVNLMSINEKTGKSKQRQYLVHRLVLMTFGYIPGCENLDVNHIDGNKSNNHIGNLEWVTHKENMRHAVDNGLLINPKGEDHPCATITNDQVRQIAKLIISRQYTLKQISEIMGTTLAIVKNISRCQSFVDICKECNLQNYRGVTRSIFSKNEVELICKYFQDNRNKYYHHKTDLFRDLMRDVFGREFIYDEDYQSLLCILNRRTFINISNNYIF